MEHLLFQFLHGCPPLEQPPEAEGFILLRPDSVQLEGGQPEGQFLCLCLIHRRAVQEPVQLPAQLHHLWRGLILRHGAGDALRVLDQAVEKLTQQEKKTLLLETREGTRRVPLDRILYAERAGRVMRCHCTDGVLDSQTLRMPFREAAAPLLADPRFYLCGASFVLNFRHVTGIKGQEALLDNGEALTLPRTAAVEFKRAWGDYWLKENAGWTM